jgi:hypothetical protein
MDQDPFLCKNLKEQYNFQAFFFRDLSPGWEIVILGTQIPSLGRFSLKLLTFC